MNKITIGLVSIFIGILVGIMIMDKCNPTIHTSPETIIVSHYKDSTYYSDTLGVWIDTVKYSKLIPTYIEIDTNRSYLNDSNLFRTKYHYKIEDSLLNATIIAISQDRPDVSFEYTLKNSIINNTITIKDSTYTKEIVKERNLYVGLESDIRPFNTIYLGLDYADKKGNLFGVSQGYDFINQYPVTKVSYKRKINFKKN